MTITKLYKEAIKDIEAEAEYARSGGMHGIALALGSAAAILSNVIDNQRQDINHLSLQNSQLSKQLKRCAEENKRLKERLGYWPKS